ncbi:MAG: AAA family ATPase [Defluviitaleaceae bacterium]|nr:AAA family ATPase [Defluviitaleaceae bacterium]
MAMRNLELKNFTVFNDITLHAGSGVNVIIGDNGTGKTHLMKILYAALLNGEAYLELNPNLPDKDHLLNLNSTGQEDINFILDNFFGIHPKDIDTEEDFDLTIAVSKISTPIFIPAKEMLSMTKMRFIYDTYSNDFPIDYTLIDIIKKAQALKPNNPPVLAKEIAPILENIIDGTVFMKDDGTFWVRKHNNMEIPFNMESEGFRKLGLLWQLIMNESIKEGTVLLWDEPEANFNPKLTPVIVDILFSLARQGVQVFLATHDYTFAKYFEIRRKEDDCLQFHSLYKTDDGVKVETGDNFKDLDENVILSSLDKLMDEVISGNMGD